MKNLLMLTYILIFTILVQAQNSPEISWTKTYGGAGMEWGYYAEQTQDGGYITIGRIDHGSLNFDAWLIKTDANGDTLWTKTFGDTYIDEAYVVKQTTNGGYIIGGASTAYGWSGEGWLIRTDSNGNVIWSRGYHNNNGSHTDWDNFFDVIETADGGFAALGFGNVNDYYWQGWIVKVDSNGNEIWNKSYGDQYMWERLYHFKQTSDGGFIAVGDKHVAYGDTTSHDGWLVKFDNNGDTLWTKNFGGSQVDIFRSIQITTEGGYMIAGEREPFWSSGYYGWIVKTDSNGNLIWNNMYGKGGLLAIQKTENDEYIAVGTKVSNQTLGDGWIVKVSSNGNLIWEKLVAESNIDDMFQSIEPCTNGGYILGGRANNNGPQAKIWLAKLEPEAPATITVFSENFDGVTPPQLPTGWTSHLEVLISNNVAEVKTMPHGLTPSQPNAVFMMNGLDGSNGQPDVNAFVALVSPQVEIESSGSILRFWATGNNNILVGTMTDPTDASTFSLIEDVTISSDYLEYAVVINEPGTFYLALKHKNTSNVTPLFVDNLSLEQVVPVELVSFKAEINKQAEIELSWSTATETNNSGFEIQRSKNGNEFINVGFIQGNGTSTEVNKYTFLDTKLETGKYYYRLRQIDFDGTSDLSNTIEVIINVPDAFVLNQNYPNPFNPTTTISFSLPVDAHVTINIFNTIGEQISRIADEEYAAGTYNINFSANELVSGVYFYTIDARGKDNSMYHAVNKMILIK